MALFLCFAQAAGFVRRRALPAVRALALAGCESVLSVPSDQLALRTTPPGAEVKTSTGESCSTPCTLQLGQGTDLTVIVSKRGFKTERIELGDRCASTVDIALRPIASITAYELPDRDLPLIADCGKRPASRVPPTGLAPIH
jgi:hypothetical protein